MRAVRLVGEQATWPRTLNQAGRRYDVVTLSFGQLERERKAEGIDDEVDLGRRTTSRSADAMNCGPPFPPAACWCARFVVLSMLCHSGSIAVCSAANSASHRPHLDHRSNRLNTVFQGPNSLGRSRHGTPVRRHHTTASKNRRSSFPGRPRRGCAASTLATRAHCSSLIHARVAMPTFDHASDQAATFRRRRVATDRNHMTRFRDTP